MAGTLIEGSSGLSCVYILQDRHNHYLHSPTEAASVYDAFSDISGEAKRPSFFPSALST